MALKPEASVTVGIATATLVYAIHQKALPSIADARTVPPGNMDMQAAERTASWVAAGSVAGISLITGDMTVFIIGGAAVIALAWWHRHSDMVIPELSQAIPHFGGESDQVGPEEMAEAEDYGYGVDAA